MKKCIHIAMALVVLFAVSCKKDKKKVNPLGDKLPEVLNNIITPQIIDSLKAHGTIIHEGLKPPTINGIYLFSPNLCDYDDSGDGYEGRVISDYVFKFSGQDNAAFKVTMQYKGAGGADEAADGSATFISGESKDFTVFAESTGKSDGIDYTALQVLSGTIVDDGIENFQLTNYLKSKGPDPFNNLTKAKSIRIFHDRDLISQELEVYATSKDKKTLGIDKKILQSFLSGRKN